MAQITINEISQNYSYNVAAASFATVALPITAQWGPGFIDPSNYPEPEDEDTDLTQLEQALEAAQWKLFSSSREGLESFVATYRGPSSNYRRAKDYSYQMAITLLANGYDVLVCRLAPGTNASYQVKYYVTNETGTQSTAPLNLMTVKAKYTGSFGDNIKILIKKNTVYKYWNIIVYVKDANGVTTAVENKICTFDPDKESDTLTYIKNVSSNYVEFLDINVDTDSFMLAELTDSTTSTYSAVSKTTFFLDGGTDVSALMSTSSTSTEHPNVNDIIDYGYNGTKDAFTPESGYYGILRTAQIRYADVFGDKAYAKAVTEEGATTYDWSECCQYIQQLHTFVTQSGTSAPSVATYQAALFREWTYTYAYYVYDLLQDKLNYAPQRIISPGWDDQDYQFLNNDDYTQRFLEISPLHDKLMKTALSSRCGCSLIDIPKSCARYCVWNEDTQSSGYAQLLSRHFTDSESSSSTYLYNDLSSTHSALFAPWATYKYTTMSKECTASPSFLALLMQRAMLKNQSVQYEWALPTNRKHNLSIGKTDYKVPKKLLDQWQDITGVGVNVITTVADLGTTVWGNSTLYEVPDATYQALANLSTRYLVDAVENICYKCGISITFQYNNEQAYNAFYAGVTPTLDTMKNVGAIDDYYVTMAADIDGLERVNANTVIGKVYLVIDGVINDINIDLICLPPGSDLSEYQQ